MYRNSLMAVRVRVIYFRSCLQFNIISVYQSDTDCALDVI